MLPHLKIVDKNRPIEKKEEVGISIFAAAEEFSRLITDNILEAKPKYTIEGLGGYFQIDGIREDWRVKYMFWEGVSYSKTCFEYYNSDTLRIIDTKLTRRFLFG